MEDIEDDNTAVLDDQQQDDEQATNNHEGDTETGATGEGGSHAVSGGQDGAPVEGDGDDSVVVTLGDEAPPASDDDDPNDPALVRTLRRELRERNARIREFEQAQAAASAAQQQPQALAKPTLEECDYDADEYERRFVAWQDQKRQAEAKQAEQEAQQRAEQEAWNSRLAAHETAKKGLKVADYEDAEEVLKGTFNVTQQAILLQGAENSALLAYAIGKNPAKAKELSSIKDPVKFAFALAKLESTVKVMPRKAPPPPEKAMRGSAPGSAAVDSTLARLEAEAERTGDRSKIVAYHRERRRQAAA